MPATDEQLVVVARSAPETAGARTALRICAERRAHGKHTMLALIGDATHLIGAAAATGAAVTYVAQDAHTRGVPIDEAAGARPVGHGELADLLLSEARVIGAF